MISCHLRGGLGNQLFQIFTTIAYSFKYKQRFLFKYSTSLGANSYFTKRLTYWDNLLDSLKYFTIIELPNNIQKLTEREFKFNELPEPEEQNTLLWGYFQSYKYFHNEYIYIKKLIRLDTKREECKQKYNFDIMDKDHVSIHFRLGDYKILKAFHPIMTFDYYKNSLQFIINKTNNPNLKIIYFCEKNDNEDVLITINELKQFFPDCTFVKASDDMCDWEQLLMMTYIKYHIIANSTFSWFGAYLSEFENKIVCYPSIWFTGSGSNIITDDLFPPSWNKISC